MIAQKVNNVTLRCNYCVRCVASKYISLKRISVTTTFVFAFSVAMLIVTSYFIVLFTNIYPDLSWELHV